MGKVLILPRTDADLQRLAYHSAPERVPDFAARLNRWRYEEMERRERARRDIALMFELAWLRQLVPPGEGA